MKNILAATSIALFALAPAAAFAQGAGDTSDQASASYPASGGAAGDSKSQKYAYGALAGVGAAAVIGAAFAVANTNSDGKNVNLGGSTGTTGTGGGTGTTGTSGTTGTQ